MMDPWLPKDYKIAKDVEIRNLIFANDTWQIYKTNNNKIYGDCTQTVRTYMAEKRKSVALQRFFVFYGLFPLAGLYPFLNFSV